MVDAMNAVSSARASMQDVLPVSGPGADSSPQMPASQQAPSRAAETVPSVQVQISTAAREAAARDALPSAQDSTSTQAAPAPANAGSAATSASATPPADARAASTDSNAAGSTAQAATQGGSAQAQQAVRAFNDVAGIGVESRSASPLRDAA